MATTIDQLIVEIKAETKGIRRGLDDVNKKLKRTNATAQKTTISFKGLSKSLAGLGLGLAALRFATFAARTAMEFEDLRISLNQVFGSIEEGEKAFDQVLDFAQRTPFQLETVSRAFIALKGAGIEPNIKQLQIFADAASTTTRQVEVFETFIRILQRSVAGGSVGLEELNQISDKGIDVFGALNRRLGISRMEVTAFGATAEGAAKIMSALTDELEVTFGGAMINKMEALSTKVSNLQIVFKQLSVEIFDFVQPAVKGFVDELTFGLNVATVLLKQLKGTMPEPFVGPPAPPDVITTDTRKQLTQEQAGFLVDLEKIIEDAVPQLDKLNDQLTLTESLRGKLDSKGEELLFTDEEINTAKTHIQGLIDELDESIHISDELGQAIQTLSLTFTKDFVDSLLEGESALASFKDFAKNIVSQIIATFMQLAVVNQILNQIFGQGTFSTFNFKTGKIVPGEVASGGKVQKGKPYMVGERGMEMFVPDTSGTIMNNMNTNNSIGGSTIVVNQSVNFATGVVPTVRAEVVKMMPQIADVTKGAVAEAAMRGGNYRRMLQGG